MTLQILWFVLWGLLWAVYFILDGFDLGVGMLYGFLGRDEAEKAAIRQSIGPVWDGNEVWVITAGGATFAAFPAAYASLFSFLYSAFLLILLALIFRGAALEFRAKAEGASWARTWDLVLSGASLLPALFFGVAFGNLFRGLPIDASGYHGTLLGMLNPYGVLTGVFFVALFAVHGALWVALKTSGELGAPPMSEEVQVNDCRESARRLLGDTRCAEAQVSPDRRTASAGSGRQRFDADRAGGRGPH